MRLRKFFTLKQHHLFAPFLTIGCICAQDLGVVISPVDYANKRSSISENKNKDDDTRFVPEEEQGLSPELLSGRLSRQDAYETGDDILPVINLADVRQRTKVYLYNDDGVMPNSVDLWKRAFGALSATFDLRPVTAADIQAGELQVARCDLFIMPGGAATPFHEKLTALGKEKIKNFAISGGKCLGVGAGAYFLSSSSKFTMPGNICIEREGVGLAQAIASGPLVAFEKTQFSQYGVSFPITYIQEAGKPRSSVFCNGGCSFDGHAKAAVIAETASGLNVVIQEAGNIVLSGVHPEFSASWVASSPHLVQEVLINSSRYLLKRILRSLSLI